LGSGDGGHELELFIVGKGKRIEARFNLETTDDRWGTSPLQAEIGLDKAWIRVQLARGWLWAFQGDSAWASSDPLALVGSLGIYRYDLGLDGRGAAIEQALGPIVVRGLYADRFGDRGFPVRLAEEDLVPLMGSAGDTAWYRPSPGLTGGDVGALEVKLSARKFSLGYGYRRDRGIHRGMLATSSPLDSSYRVELDGTDESWRASVLWFEGRFKGQVRGGVAIAWGEATVRKRVGTVSVLTAPADLWLGSQAREMDLEVPYQKSSRIWLGLGKWGGVGPRPARSSRPFSFRSSPGPRDPGRFSLGGCGVPAPQSGIPFEG